MSSDPAIQRAAPHLCLVPGLVVALIGGCGDYLPAELAGLVAEELQTAATTITLPEEQRACVPHPNRCGPPGVGLLVPDCPLDSVCFIDACNAHDVCYATCGSTRPSCDDGFLDDMTSICTETVRRDHPELLRCLSLAYVYWQVVVRLGEPSFEALQRRACACPDTDEASIARAKPLDAAPRDIRPFDDRDDDLMPDDWETRVGLDPLDPTDALPDFDSDGLINLQEFLYDGDPFQAD